MIAKAEVLQKLKKMGMVVADDASIVTVLLPAGVPFETGLKDVKAKLKELGYEASFCVKQSKDADVKKEVPKAVEKEEFDVDMTEDFEERFALDDDGQFSLGLEF